MKIIVFSFLTLLSGSLVADPVMPEEMLRGRNSQYKEGYRDGFREAINMMNGGGGGSNMGRNIQISSAIYGSSRGRCDFTQQLAQAVNDQRSYRLRAGNEWCGDPSNGYKKSASVEYFCQGNRKKAFLREGQVGTLNCD